ncbi:MAG: hypothetical protein OEY52_06435 [Gammaproteobacteria bacterium]|nr:hypothetical protein [Gammaproteobacteria bacterium]
MSDNFLWGNPILPVRSAAETAKFFEEKLGFTISVLWKNPSYCVVRRGDVVVEFGEGRKQHAGTGVCVIGVEDADIVYEEWQAKGLEFVGDFAERDYGSKDFRVRDNNGNMLIIGHALKNQQELLDKGNLVSQGQ